MDPPSTTDSSDLEIVATAHLPVELAGPLNVARCEGLRDGTETTATAGAAIGVTTLPGSSPRLRRVEVRMVEGVEGFEAELNPHHLAEAPVLFKRGVPVLIVRTTQIGEVARRIAEAAVRREGEGSGIEPLMDAGVRGVNVADDIRPRIATVSRLVIAEDADGNAALESCDAGEFPSADNGVGDAAHA